MNLSVNSTGKAANEPPGHSNNIANDEFLGWSVFFVLFTLGIGAITRWAIQHFSIRLPYTILMLIMGMIFSIVTTLVGRHTLGIVGYSTTEFGNVDPHILLMVFLPALLFESAFTCNFHIIWTQLGQALMLAGPGVAISTVLVALFCREILLYDWSWPISLMFGAVVSATDPVAVIALFRELGASARLKTLIEAESLLNDGTAYAVFLLFKDIEIGIQRTPVEMLWYFCRLALGGAAFGILSGIFFCGWLRCVFKDDITETTLTITAAYLTFWLSESFHVSGVLAVVFLGLYASKNKAVITPAAEEHLHFVWMIISFIANTIIFFLSGIIIVQVFSNIHMRWKDVILGLVMYIALHAIRLLTVLLLAPFLRHMGYGLKPATGAVLVYVGLRGAVSLLLGLLVHLNDKFPHLVRDQFMFQVSCVVFLTLTINGITTEKILGLVGLTKVKRASSIMWYKRLDNINDETEKLIRVLQMDSRYSGASWDDVRKMIPKYDDTVSTRRCKSSSSNGRVLKKKKTNPLIYISSSDRNLKNEMFYEVNHRFLSITHASFGRQYEDGDVTRDAIAILEEASELGLDREKDALHTQWTAIDAYTKFHGWHKLLYNRAPSFIAERVLYSQVILSMELIKAYLKSLEGIELLIKDFMDGEHISELKDEQKKLRGYALEKWSGLEETYPEIYRSIQTRHATQHILAQEKHHIENLYKRGLIKERENVKLVEELNNSMHNLIHHAHSLGKMKRNQKNEKILDLPFFEFLTDSIQQELLNAEERIFSPEEIVYKLEKNCGNNRFAVPTLLTRSDRSLRVLIGTMPVNVYIITRGFVVANAESYAFERVMSAGSVIGLVHPLTSHIFPQIMTAKSPVHAVVVSSNTVSKMAEIPKVRNILWKIVARDIIEYYFHDQFFSAYKMTPGSSHWFATLCNRANVIEALRDMIVDINTPVLLMRGGGTRLFDNTIITAPVFFVGRRKQIKFFPGSVRVVFQNPSLFKQNTIVEQSFTPFLPRLSTFNYKTSLRDLLPSENKTIVKQSKNIHESASSKSPNLIFKIKSPRWIPSKIKSDTPNQIKQKNIVSSSFSTKKDQSIGFIEIIDDESELSKNKKGYETKQLIDKRSLFVHTGPKEMEKKINNNCPGRHALVYRKIKKVGLNCDACGKKQLPVGYEIFSCHKCSWNCCKNCEVSLSPDIRDSFTPQLEGSLNHFDGSIKSDEFDENDVVYPYVNPKSISGPYTERKPTILGRV